MMDRQREAFREEAAELLAELEVSLLELERHPDNSELIGRVFRALHTLKGSGAMFGFDDLAGFAHEVETVFDGVRDGCIAVTPELVGITLAARDHIQALLRESAGDGAVEFEAGRRILDRLRRVAPGGEPTADPPSADPAIAMQAERCLLEEPSSYRIRFEPQPDILLTGTNPVLLLRELESMGEYSGIAHLERIPELDELDCERCYVFWDAVLTTAADENTLRDVFIFVEDRAKVEIRPIERAVEAEHQRLGDLLVERGDIAPEQLEGLLGGRPKVGEILVEAGLVTPDRVHAAVIEQQHLDAVRDKRRKAEAASTLRVPAAKLDSLVNIVGELVTVQARLSGYARNSGDTEIGIIAEDVERLAEMLRENTMSIRMLPIGETFGRFKRLVRDLSGELGKKVELITEGNETELDKGVIEQLSDPLVHLIRNSIDHGIESPELRTAARKSESGSIQLSAVHAGAHVLIRVSDDGAGLNRTAIRARAVERGLITADAALTDAQIDALIFAPGFSTAERVTEVSGRGVGMDVVQRSIDALRGTLSVASTPGRGTSITLKIPLTLAIIDGLLVEAGGAYFVLPLSNILECIELIRETDAGAPRGNLVAVRDELVPYIVIRERFSIPGDAPRIEQVIIADTHDGKCGFVVDRVIGDHHTVVKKLGHLYRHIDEVSGATILGDGTVALILDPDKLSAGALREAC